MPAHDDTTTTPDPAPRAAADEAARAADEAAAEDEPRELLLMRAGGLAFALYAGEVETVVPWSRPAPLPHAPAAVLGVVSARGRMRTVLDPAGLLREAAPSAVVAAGADAVSGGEASADAAGTAAQSFDFVACLRGDEQLALAFESAERSHLPAGEPLAPHDPADLPARGRLARGGETVFLLDPSKLFAAAVRGTERRRTRRAR